jgi:hypothetical protein
VNGDQRDDQQRADYTGKYPKSANEPATASWSIAVIS